MNCEALAHPHEEGCPAPGAASGALLCGAKAKVMMTATSGQNPAESANAAPAASPIAPCPTVPVEEKTPELIVDPPAATTSRLMANVPSVMTACDSGAATHSHANTALTARIIVLLCMGIVVLIRRNRCLRSCGLPHGCEGEVLLDARALRNGELRALEECDPDTRGFGDPARVERRQRQLVLAPPFVRGDVDEQADVPPPPRAARAA